MPTLDELREARDTAEKEMLRVTANGFRAAVRGEVHWKLHEADEALIAAQQQRIAALEHLKLRANGLLGSCWSLLQHVLGGHYPRPEIEQMVNELEALNDALHADAGEKGE